MRISIRSKVGILVSLIALLAIIGGYFTYAVATRSSSAAHASADPVSYKASQQNVSTSTTINPTKLAVHKYAPTGKIRSGHEHDRPSTSAKFASPNHVSRPSASSLAMSSTRLLTSFDGINALQNAQASGFDVEPPDEGLAVNAHYVINLVNTSGAIYHRNGTIAAGPFYINDFFGEPASAFLSDPRAYYDVATHTWFAIIWEADFTNFSESHIDVAVNHSGDPTATWTIYHIDTTDSTGAGCPCLPDYTIFGIDQYNIYLVSNEFSLAGSQFNGSQIYAVSKMQLIHNQPLNVVHFGGLSLGGMVPYHLQPAITHGSSKAEFFMNSLDPNSTFDNRLGVWAMTQRKKVGEGGMPNLSAVIVKSEAYGFAVSAPNPNGNLLDSGGDPMLEVEYIHGHLLGALDTSVTIPGDTGTRDGIAWFEVQPDTYNQVIQTTTHVTKQGYVAAQGEYLLYPNIQQTYDGTTVMAFSMTSPSTYPSAAYAVMPVRSGNFSAIHLAAAGAASDTGFTCTSGGGPCRWGDYSAGQIDPVSNTVWFATQYIPNNGDQYANWGNRIFQVMS